MLQGLSEQKEQSACSNECLGRGRAQQESSLLYNSRVRASGPLTDGHTFQMVKVANTKSLPFRLQLLYIL
jgi:hypothetical protein